MGLENEFHHAMIGVADFANAHGFGIRFRQMLGEYGGVETASVCFQNKIFRAMGNVSTKRIK